MSSVEAIIERTIRKAADRVDKVYSMSGKAWVDVFIQFLAPELTTLFEKAEDQAKSWESALESIAANRCCKPCQEAALVARASLDRARSASSNREGGEE